MLAVFISLVAVSCFASAESVVDCVTTDWADSGSCSVTCGGGLQEQTRSVVTPAANGGACCGALTQAISCNNEACPTTTAVPATANSYTWVQQGENSCKDQDGQSYNYCSKDMFSATATMVECQAAVDTLDQTKIAGLGWQTSSNGGGICVIHMMSQDACSGFQSDGWNCVCWNYPGNGLPAPSANGNPAYPCFVRSASAEGAEAADCALRESNDIFVKRAAMCGGEACVAIRNDEQRTAVAWGRVDMGTSGSFATVDLTNAAQITCGYWSCAVVKTDGSAQAWGMDYYNQGVDDLDLPSRRDITMVDCGHSACVALTSNGDALFWGGPAYMGDMAPGSSVEGENFVDAGCGGTACWAMKADSSVMVWGQSGYGGNPPEGALTDVKKIQCGAHKCVSITNQGRLYTWGDVGYGGLLEPNVGDAIIADAMCGPYVCIAFSDQGEVFTWGSYHQLEPTAPSTVTDVVSAHCGYGCCVALKSDGTAISWGKSNYLHGYSGPYTNVRETHCGGYLCIALKNDGSVVSWGLANQKAGYSTLISNGDLSSDIAKVQCGIRACIAVKSDGTAFTWGDSTYGGNSGGVDLTNIALDFPCESSTAGRRELVSQPDWIKNFHNDQVDDYPVAEQYALRDRLLRL